MASRSGAGMFGYSTHCCEPDEGFWSNSRSMVLTTAIAASHLTQPEDSEDYTSELVAQIAQSMLRESDENIQMQDCSLFQKQNSICNAQTLPTSPQTTLAGMSWGLLSPSASSSGGLSSGVSSPPIPMEASGAAAASSHDEKDALDVLYAELLRLKMEDEIQARQKQLMQLKQRQQYQQLLWEIRKQQAASMSEASEGYGLVHCNAKYPTTHNAVAPGYYFQRRGNDGLSQICAHKSVNGEETAWSSPGVLQSYQSAASRHRSGVLGDPTSSNGEKHHSFYNHNRYSTATKGSGMRAVFLGTPGARESSGTGVFLPRPIGGGGSSADTRRKPACSTVLLPSRIVQALNLNVEDTLGCPAVSSVLMSTRRDHNDTPFHGNSPPSDRPEPLLNVRKPTLNGLLSFMPLQEAALDVCHSKNGNIS